MNDLITKIEQWGKEKGILDKGTIHTQFGKMWEEVEELGEALSDKELHDYENPDSPSVDIDTEVELELGDVVVTAVLLAKQHGTDIQSCLNKTFQKIVGREGEMVDGLFVKKSY